jgi:hypothetical protein
MPVLFVHLSTMWCHKYCGVFTPRKNCNIKTRSHDYATVDEAVFSPCREEPSSDVTWRVANLLASSSIASPRLLPGNSYKHLDDARVGRGHVTASAVTSHVSTVTQQLKRFLRVRARVYRRDWSSFRRSSQWEIAVSSWLEIAVVLGSREPRKVRSEDEELTCDWKDWFMCNFWSVRLW